VDLVGNAPFRIGQWRVDPALDEISRDGATVKLEPRTMRVLVCLAEHAGEVISVNHPEAAAAFGELIRLDPENKFAFGSRGLAHYGMGDLQGARSSCEIKLDHWVSQWCLAMTYDKLGRHADAEAELAKMKAANGIAAAYQYATSYAQWGNAPQSLEWLDTAVRLRDPGLPNLKTDPLMDPLRNEPRFQAIERALKFPD
jgi:tetratricopeptide (TPR) repeat protein